MPTIHDIAGRAGVSKSTVSRVLSDHGYVKEETRVRITRAMEELHYTPNYVARGMRTNKSSTIGLFIPDVSNPFYSELFKGIEQVTRAAGYINLVCHTATDPAAEIFYIDELLKRQIDGVIICTYHRNPKTLEYFSGLARKKPIVFMDHVFDDENFCYVVSDGFTGIKNAVAHLVGKGSRKIAFITGPNDHAVTRERYRGYLQGLTEAGLAADPDHVYDGDFSHESGRAAVRHFLSLPARPDAIVSSTDVMAAGALRELNSNSIAVPDEMKVVGFDNIPLCELTHPSLSTVGQPIGELGINAAELLLKKIRSPETPNQQIVMQCTLVERESSR